MYPPIKKAQAATDITSSTISSASVLKVWIEYSTTVNSYDFYCQHNLTSLWLLKIVQNEYILARDVFQLLY